MLALSVVMVSVNLFKPMCYQGYSLSLMLLCDGWTSPFGLKTNVMHLSVFVTFLL